MFSEYDSIENLMSVNTPAVIKEMNSLSDYLEVIGVMARGRIIGRRDFFRFGIYVTDNDGIEIARYMSTNEGPLWNITSIDDYFTDDQPNFTLKVAESDLIKPIHDDESIRKRLEKGEFRDLAEEYLIGKVFPGRKRDYLRLDLLIRLIPFLERKRAEYKKIVRTFN
jgi:hypothetical protein